MSLTTEALILNTVRDQLKIRITEHDKRKFFSIVSARLASDFFFTPFILFFSFSMKRTSTHLFHFSLFIFSYFTLSTLLQEWFSTNFLLLHPSSDVWFTISPTRDDKKFHIYLQSLSEVTHAHRQKTLFISFLTNKIFPCMNLLFTNFLFDI